MLNTLFYFENDNWTQFPVRVCLCVYVHTRFYIYFFISHFYTIRFVTFQQTP